MQSPRDHQVHHEPRSVVETDRDTLADAPEPHDRVTGRVRERRIDGANERDAPNPHAEKHASHDARLEGTDVDGDVGKLRHRARPSCASVRRALRKFACRAELQVCESRRSCSWLPCSPDVPEGAGRP
jgi:hypothetical protein